MIRAPRPHEAKTLHEAAARGDLVRATALVKAGVADYISLQDVVDAKFEDLMARTPLHLAAEHGHVKVIEFLCGHAADVDAKDSVRHASVASHPPPSISCLNT